jgi:hypothetical protein
VGRDGYGDILLVLRRGTHLYHLFFYLLFDATQKIIILYQLGPANELDIRSPSIHTQARTWVTDYLIGCHASEESGLSVLVGSNEQVFPLHSYHHLHYVLTLTHQSPRGDIALLRNTNLYDPFFSSWSLERLWTGHHEGVVRSALLDERVSAKSPCSVNFSHRRAAIWFRPTSFSRGEKMRSSWLGRMTLFSNRETTCPSTGTLAPRY